MVMICDLCGKTRRTAPLNLGPNFEHHLNVCAPCGKPFDRAHATIRRIKERSFSDAELEVAVAELRSLERDALAGRVERVS